MLIITYADKPAYLNMAMRMNSMCDKMGFQFECYSRSWLIGQPEYASDRMLFNSQKGGGYWAWKPLIILDALKSSDTVIYLDSSVMIPNKEAILRIAEDTEQLSAAKTSYINRDWTKRLCFKIMSCDTEEYWTTEQVWAGVICAKQSGIELLHEWRNYCLDYNIISDSRCKDNFAGFMAHRHDQSILTNLLLRHRQKYIDVTGFYDKADYSGIYLRTK
jgi:hypothetical protein